MEPWTAASINHLLNVLEYFSRDILQLGWNANFLYPAV